MAASAAGAETSGAEEVELMPGADPPPISTPRI
jgi:hypothetical protein